MIKLHDELREYVYGPSSFSSSYAMKLVEGGSIGDIYGRAFERDATGRIVYEAEGDSAGLPRTVGDGNTVKVGNANPVFSLSWGNTFSYKGMSLSVLLDCRYGGRLLSRRWPTWIPTGCRPQRRCPRPGLRDARRAADRRREGFLQTGSAAAQV